MNIKYSSPSVHWTSQPDCLAGSPIWGKTEMGISKNSDIKRLFFIPFKWIILISIIIFLFSCGTKKEEKQAPEKPVQEKKVDEGKEWQEVVSSIAKVVSYDGDRILETGRGFFVAEDLLVTKYSLLNDATNALITPFDEN
ncbi:MAG: hypothetical protein JXR31_15290, partial [Prolixibacteraceae bacterium]|nr:hypothetical protein [Prolixibacteraceae bacterium]